MSLMCSEHTAASGHRVGVGGGEEDEVGARRAQAVQGCTWTPAE